MRSPVFRKNTNFRIDPPIFRKSLAYVRSLVNVGDARWNDSKDEALGVTLMSGHVTAENHPSREHAIPAGTMHAAWGMYQSGYAGPLVFQMRREQNATA